MGNSSLPEVTSQFTAIVMPAFNEELYIAAAINSLLQPQEPRDYELLVLDGGSSDRTPAIVQELAKLNPRIKLIHNTRRTQSAAMNIAASICDPRATVLVRADCHASYPPHFVSDCVATLRETASSSVVVSMRAVGRSPLQKIFAAAQNSRLGNGGSAHRRQSQSGYVDHGHHAAFDRQAFLSLGGYDETVQYNEDAEFDARLVASGRRIYHDGRLLIDYYPRTSFPSLARQYFRHGKGRANTLLKHKMRPKLRQMLPVFVLLASVIALAAYPFIGSIALLVPAGYILVCMAWGAYLAAECRQPSFLLIGPAAITMHMSWAAGFLSRFLWGNSNGLNHAR